MLDPRPELANDYVHLFDPNSRINDSYGSWGVLNYSTRAQKTAQNYENYRSWNGDGVQFRPESIEDESGVCSPPLWKTSPPTSPASPRHHQNNYRYLSPTSRTQAIARGQRELMEMVKRMPESSYELSLKDLVEQQPRIEAPEECLLQEKEFDDEVVHQRVKVKRQESKRNEKKTKMMRNASFDHGGGLFLKMVFPISFGSKKKKKNSSVTNTCAKVSPKPENFGKASKVAEKDWWKKRFSGSSSSRTSSNSGSSGSSGSSSNNRKQSSFLPGCWSFFSFKNRKSGK
ncbi:unnamed protein product [Ilex paraguariensis]|uniref:Uncharacterized protein n=1 Tax=Ilex paraguariensis TaxID=185542 RepID=A0ABC8S9U9_9AQUA